MPMTSQKKTRQASVDIRLDLTKSENVWNKNFCWFKKSNFWKVPFPAKMNLEAQKLKQLGNEAYKKKYFYTALKNYGNGAKWNHLLQ